MYPERRDAFTVTGCTDSRSAAHRAGVRSEIRRAVHIVDKRRVESGGGGAEGATCYGARRRVSDAKLGYLC